MINTTQKIETVGLVCINIVLSFLCFSVSSCGDGELNPLVTVDAGSDADSDTDTDSDTELECPLNSGYPCACDPQNGTCDDGTACIIVGPSSLGMCLIACGPGDPACQATDGYGLNGWCGFDANGPPESNQFDHCIVTCRYKYEMAPCPPALACMPHLADGIPPQEICVPSF